MWYTYIIQSKKDGHLYTGITDDLRKRLSLHNSGKVPSTQNRAPFEIIYYEAYKSEKDAQERERQVKRRAKAHISLKRRIKNSINE